MNTKTAVNSRRWRRFRLLFGAVVLGALSLALIFRGLSLGVNYYAEPAQLVMHGVVGEHVRTGGLVKKGSYRRDEKGVAHFTIEGDKLTGAELAVTTTSIIPKTFVEGSGAVLEGQLNQSGIFEADRVLAKHDENYVPRELVDDYKKRGIWRGPDVVDFDQ